SGSTSTPKPWRRLRQEECSENRRDCRSLPAGDHVHRIWAERLPKLYSSASAAEPVGFAILYRDLCITLLSFLLRRPTRSRTASALWILRTAGASPLGC